MAAQGQKWTFKQLGGPRKTLELSGWGAPFGRPRKDAIVDDGMELRLTERRYAGNDEPTYHIFGLKYDDWELKGRWMDSAGGAGFARDKVQEVKEFIADAQRCIIVWGGTRVVYGVVTKLVPGWESEADAAWKLTIKIAKDQKLGATPKTPQARSVQSYTNRMIEAMSDVLHKTTTLPPTIRGSFISTIDSIITLINSPANTLVQLAGSIDNLKNATIGEIRRFNAGLAQYKTSLTRLRDVYENTLPEIALEFNETDRALDLSSTQALFGNTMVELLRQAVQAQEDAARAERSRIKSLYTAKSGDRWEMVAKNGPSVAKILEANDLPGGSQPVPGATYVIPV